jgi:hypothetical protein
MQKEDIVLTNLVGIMFDGLIRGSLEIVKQIAQDLIPPG